MIHWPLQASLLIACVAMITSSAEAGPPTQLQGNVISDPLTGLTLVLPHGLHVARYADNPALPPPTRQAIPRVLVLVEDHLHSASSNTLIPIGSLPVISIDLLTGERAQFNRVFLRPEFRRRIGDREVYGLPAHQGPVQHQLFYYLVPLSADQLVEIAGHRYQFTDRHAPPTGYDTLISEIIQSLNSTNFEGKERTQTPGWAYPDS